MATSTLATGDSGSSSSASGLRPSICSDTLAFDRQAANPSDRRAAASSYRSGALAYRASKKGIRPVILANAVGANRTRRITRLGTILTCGPVKSRFWSRLTMRVQCAMPPTQMTHRCFAISSASRPAMNASRATSPSAAGPACSSNASVTSKNSRPTRGANSHDGSDTRDRLISPKKSRSTQNVGIFRIVACR